MQIDDFPSNSKVDQENRKEPEKKPEKPKVTKHIPEVQGTVQIHKKTTMDKFKEAFSPQDIAEVKSYVLDDVIIPKTKQVLFDILDSGLKAVFFGTDSAKTSNSSASNSTKVSYRNYFDRGTVSSGAAARSSSYRSRQNQYTFKFEAIEFSSKGYGESILASLEELIDAQGYARVSDMNELTSVEGKYTDNGFGWTNISTARVIFIADRNMYTFKMPTAIALPVDD